MKTRVAAMRPWHAVLLTLVATPLGGSLCTAVALAGTGHRSAATRVLIVGGISVFILLGLLVQPLDWLVIAGLTLCLNIIVGLANAWLLRQDPPLVRLRRLGAQTSLGTICWGVCGIALLASQVGTAVGVAYLLGMDQLISTLFPSIAGRFHVLLQLGGLLFDFAVLGAAMGVRVCARTPQPSARQVGWAVGGLVLSYYVGTTFWTLLVTVPAFHAAARFDPSHLLPLMVIVWCGQLATSLLGAFWFAQLADADWRPRLLTSGLVMTTVLGMILSFMAYTGRFSYDCLLLGQRLEKRGHLAAAQQWYELGIAQRPDDETSSYLQFHVALLLRKRQHNDQARAAFSKVVTTFTSQQALVATAQRFLNALDQAPPHAKRYVIPGIETRTEFKSAYCMPNSLSLVLQYWGVPVSAKAIGQQITAADIGTTLTDTAWYVQRRGLQHWILPLASVEDVKQWLDQRIPVLLYVPHHVLAVLGYDEALESFIVYDVATEDIWVDHPIEQFLPRWKHELAIIGIVLPPERFAQLPEDQQQRLQRLTRAYLHHELHLPYHVSDEPADRDRALAHLQAAVTLAPEFFFDVAHMYVRTSWSRQREPLARAQDLAALTRAGVAFTKHDFTDDEVLRELSWLMLDVNQREPLRQFLESLYTQGTLKHHDELVQLLGLLEYQQGHVEAAIGYLSTLKGLARSPLILAQAFEATKSWQAAMNEYQRLLVWDVDTPPDVLEEDTGQFVESMLFVRRQAMGRMVALADQAGEPERLRESAAQYLLQFPWDLATQRTYAQHVAETLAPEHDLQTSVRQARRRELLRTLQLLRALDLEGNLTDQLKALEESASQSAR